MVFNKTILDFLLQQIFFIMNDWQATEMLTNKLIRLFYYNKFVKVAIVIKI